MSENPRYNEHDYPPSPAYYQQHGADCRDHVTPEYWRDSAFVHLFRAGRKGGETVAEALVNAFLCLALWFRSQGLPVPYYSAELARMRDELGGYRTESKEGGEIASDLTVKVAELRAENARLRAELDRIAAMANTIEVFKDEAADAVVAQIRRDLRPGSTPGEVIYVNKPEYNPETGLYRSVWFGVMPSPTCDHDARSASSMGTPLESDAPTTVNEYTGDTSVAPGPCPVAAVLRPTPTLDTPAGLLSVETDGELREWLDGSEFVRKDGRNGEVTWESAAPKWISHDPYGHNHRQPWIIHRVGSLKAPDAARTLHRILTGGTP